MLFAERIPWFHSIDSVKELAAQRGAFAATLKVDSSILAHKIVAMKKLPVKVSKVVMGEVKEVEVGVVNTHLATWYSDTEAKWSQVYSGIFICIYKCKGNI